MLQNKSTANNEDMISTLDMNRADQNEASRANRKFENGVHALIECNKLPKRNYAAKSALILGNRLLNTGPVRLYLECDT